jgi:membrane protein required for colicin V production
MPFTILDLVVIGVMLISALLASLRGFTREVLAIGSWVAAALVAYLAYKQVTPYVVQQLPTLKSPVPEIIAGAGIFFVTLIIAYMLTGRISDMILDSRIGALDRTLGFIFGAARGLLLMVIAFLFFQFFAGTASYPWVDAAKTKPLLAASAEKLKALIPEDIDSYVAKLKPAKSADAPKEGDIPNTPPSPPAGLKK